jgi:hypothetical protein
LAITEEMEILFSASIAQLTFGLSEFELHKFTELELSASAFYSKLLQRKVKGLTFERGRIIISWPDFEKGYRVAMTK